MRSAELLRAELQRLRRPWWELHDASCEADRCRTEMRRLIDATKIEISSGSSGATMPVPKRAATVADLMREWRRLAGLNTAAAGERLGLSPRAIEDIEQGRRRADDVLTGIALKKLIEDAK
jgi:DNA-binding XRE family transcriptional regulator